MNTLDFDQIIKRMENDPLFSLLYPACEVKAVDTDAAIQAVQEIAKILDQTEMSVACLYRSYLIKNSPI